MTMNNEGAIPPSPGSSGVEVASAMLLPRSQADDAPVEVRPVVTPQQPKDSGSAPDEPGPPPRTRDDDDSGARDAGSVAASPPDQLLTIGTVGSMVLVFACLVFALLLCWRLVTHALIGTPDVLLIRVLLSCVAAFIGMGFACLGFGLFLIRARGSLSASGNVPGGGGPAAIATNAPGLVVVICATVVIGMALSLSWNRSVSYGPQAGSAQDHVDAAADGVFMPVNPPSVDPDHAAAPSPGGIPSDAAMPSSH